MDAAHRDVWPDEVTTVLLDAGGVLLDLDYAYLRRLIEASHGQVDLETLARFEATARNEIHKQVVEGGQVSGAWRDYFHIILGRSGVAGDDQPRIIDSLWEAHQRFGLWTVAIDGAIDTVRALKRHGLRLGVVSNAEGRVAQDLDGAGFEGMFETVIDSHVVGVEKPDPAIFGLALEQMRADAASTIFVGDLPAVDVVGARAAGLTPVLLDRHGIYPPDGTWRIESIGALTSLLGLDSPESADAEAD